MSILKISYRPDPSYEGYISVRLIGEFAGVGGFSGEPSAFADLADKLASYPIDANDPPAFGAEEVDIEIVPADSVGHLRLTLALGYPTGPCSYLRASFRTEYAWIARFEQALRTFIAAPQEELVLEIR